mmetsp:Transcript_16483/g.29961  ORF Transcript_16483/g.29961 Transcript_16483/m.29961 type:complete len:135 (-) Transcript_16483:56-460(-)
MVALETAEISAATSAAGKKAKDMGDSHKQLKSPPKKHSMKQRMKSEVMKSEVISKVKSRTIDYAMSNPIEVVKCYRLSENPKRRLALQAMGIKGKMKEDETKKGKTKKGETKKWKMKKGKSKWSCCWEWSWNCC